MWAAPDFILPSSHVLLWCSHTCLNVESSSSCGPMLPLCQLNFTTILISMRRHEFVVSGPRKAGRVSALVFDRPAGLGERLDSSCHHDITPMLSCSHALLLILLMYCVRAPPLPIPSPLSSNRRRHHTGMRHGGTRGIINKTGAKGAGRGKHQNRDLWAWSSRGNP